MITINTIQTRDINSMGLSQTSKGVLLKWNTTEKYYKSGSLHYGIFNKIQPIVECISSDIRNLLGIKGVDYTLDTIHSNGCEDFEPQDILCCVSNNFLKCDETLVTFAKHYKNFSGELTYEKLISEFNCFEREINQTIIFDFIINNIDRHFNNFGYIINGNTKYCPIFDNGLSLYSDLNSEEINNINKNKFLAKRYDKSKPFASKHTSQIKLISNLPPIDLSSSNGDFISIINKYDSYLSKDRIEAMSNLLEERLNYVRNMYSNA